MSNPYPGKGIVAGSDIGLQRANDVANLTTGEKRSTDGQSLRVFFQHHTGELRWLLRTPTGDVEGGTSAEVIATDAKSGTPLGLISTSDTFTQWHVFCKHSWREENPSQMLIFS